MSERLGHLGHLRHVFAALAAFACVCVVPSGVHADGGKRIRIGVIADITGSAAALGIAQKNAIELAAEDLDAGAIRSGGATLIFDIEDAGGDPAQVATLVQRFASDGTALVIGPTLEGEAESADPIAVRASLTVLAISSAGGDVTAQGPCVFDDALTAERIVEETIARIVTRLHPRSAALVYDARDAAASAERAAFEVALQTHRVAVVDVERYGPDRALLAARLGKIARKAPDLLVVDASPGAAARIVVAARRAGIRGRIVGGKRLDSPKLLSLAGRAADGTIVGAPYFAANRYAGNAAFARGYRKRFGSLPDATAAQAYAAAQLAAAAARSGATTAVAMCSAFAALPVTRTVLGPVDFDRAHAIRAASATLVVSNGGFGFF